MVIVCRDVWTKCYGCGWEHYNDIYILCDWCMDWSNHNGGPWRPDATDRATQHIEGVLVLRIQVFNAEGVARSVAEYLHAWYEP